MEKIYTSNIRSYIELAVTFWSSYIIVKKNLKNSAKDNTSNTHFKKSLFSALSKIKASKTLFFGHFQWTPQSNSVTGLNDAFKIDSFIVTKNQKVSSLFNSLKVSCFKNFQIKVYICYKFPQKVSFCIKVCTSKCLFYKEKLNHQITFNYQIVDLIY